MNDKELIALSDDELVRIYQQAWDVTHRITHSKELATRSGVAAVQEAVLTALGDRLLPELPEGFDYVKVRLTNTSNERMLIGYGPTITAAIRAALEPQP